jgi:uncharacterized membrane protein YciS (DUF1049 family)
MSAPQPPGIPDTPPPAPPAEPSAAGKTSAGAAAANEQGVEEDRPSTWQPWLYVKIGLLIFAIAWAIAFVAENSQQINVHFVFATANVHVVWMILLLLGVGLLGGVLLSQLYRHRRRAKLAQEARKPRDARADVGRRDEAEGKAR